MGYMELWTLFGIVCIPSFSSLMSSHFDNIGENLQPHVESSMLPQVHIDLGVSFEQGRILPTPETIPFRLTRDVV